MQIDLLIFERPPEPLGKDVVQRSPTAIHADLHAGRFQSLCVLRTGEVAPLIAVPNRRGRHPQSLLYGFEHKGDLQGVVQRPTEHIARKPVQNCDQVQPTPAQTHVCNVHSPDMIWMRRRHIPQQIGIDPMVGMRAAELRAGINGGDTHLVHIVADRVARDRSKRRFQQRLDLARPVEWAGRKQLVDPMFDRHLACRRRRRPVIEMRTADVEQGRLQAKWQVVGWQLNQRSSSSIREAGSFFFSQLSCVVRRPISAYSSSRCWVWASLSAAMSSRRSKMVERPLSAWVRQSRRTFGWTPYSALIWPSVFSSFSKSRATCALNAAV